MPKPHDHTEVVVKITTLRGVDRAQVLQHIQLLLEDWQSVQPWVVKVESEEVT